MFSISSSEKAVDSPPGSTSFLTTSKSKRYASPSPHRSPHFYATQAASTSTVSILLPAPILSPPSSPPSSPPGTLGRINSEPNTPRGRVARPPTAPSQFIRSIPLSNGLSNLSMVSERTGLPKIRFAPLPEVRTRSYSTGHNLFLEAGDVTDGNLERQWIRRDGGESTENAISDEEQEDTFKKPRHGEDSIFSSDRFKMEGQKVGKSASVDNFSTHSNKSQESMTMKILTFGLGGKKKKVNRPSTSEGTGHLTTGEPLSRVSSIESDVSRGSSVSGISAFSGASSNRRNEPRTWGSEAGGIRRTAATTDHNKRWEIQQILSKSSSSASVSSHQYAPSRRANYPPVAQRSKKKPKPAADVPDPKFVEWGFKSAGSSGGGMGNNRKNGINVDEDEEEEGSGLAWIKKRKEERRLKAEAEEMEKVAEEVREAERLLASSNSAPSINLIPTSPILDTTPTFPLVHSSEPIYGSPIHLDHLDHVRKIESNDSLIGQADSPSFTESPVSTPSEEIDEPDYRSGSMSTIAPIKIRKASKRSTSPSYRPPIILSDEEESDAEKHKNDDDDDSDLDEEELAVEEALKEKARLMLLTEAAGGEKIFDRAHHAHVIKVDVEEK